MSDIHTSHDSTPPSAQSYVSPPWPESPHIPMPDYRLTDQTTGLTYASAIFTSCIINDTGVSEIILVNRQQYHNPLLYLEIPLDQWQSHDYLNDLSQCLPWQDASPSLIDPDFIHHHNLHYLPPLATFGRTFLGPAATQLNPAYPAHATVFRPCDVSVADSVLIKSVWHIPTDSGDAYHHEHRNHRFDDAFINTGLHRSGALVFRRAASEYYPYGADYWIFALAPHSATTPSVSIKIIYTSPHPSSYPTPPSPVSR